MESTAPLAHEAQVEDRVDVPNLVWWVLILGSLSLLAVQSLHTPFYAWYTTTLHPLPGQDVMLWILIACLPIHLFEAAYVFRLAQKLGLNQSAPLWAIQTFMLGYPSTRLMLARAKVIRRLKK